MTKPTFEDALTVLDSQGIQLFDCQKEILRIVLEKEASYFLPSRFCSRRLYLENLKLITQLLTKENGE